MELRLSLNKRMSSDLKRIADANASKPTPTALRALEEWIRLQLAKRNAGGSPCDSKL